jgi:hypothetical protein
MSSQVEFQALLTTAVDSVVKNLGEFSHFFRRAVAGTMSSPAVYLGITMLAFGALNFAIGISMLGERGARNRVRCAS